jgi:hypothetical protein
MRYILGIVFALLLGACSDAERGKIEAIGQGGHIECWSAGVKYYDGESTGKVMTEHETDGWFFVEKGSNQLIRVSGSCVIRN